MSAVIALFPTSRRNEERAHAVRALRRAGYEMHVLRLASGRLIPEFRRTPGRAISASREGA